MSGPNQAKCNHCGKWSWDDEACACRKNSELAPARSYAPLVIPLDADKVAVIPLGISLDDFKRLQKTLKLWKKRMVLPNKEQEQEAAYNNKLTDCGH